MKDWSISKISDKEFWLTIERGGSLKNKTIILKAKNYVQAVLESKELINPPLGKK